MFRTCLAAASLLLATTGAQAFEFKGAEVTLGYTSLTLPDFGDARLDNTFIGGRATVGFGEAFEFTLGLNGASSDILFDEMTVLSLLANYNFSETFGLGLFYDRARTSGFFAAETVEHYGLQGSFSVDNFELTAFAGRAKSNYDVTADFFGFDGRYLFGNGLDAGFFFKKEIFDGETSEFYGLNLGYAFQGDSAVPVYINASIARSDSAFSKGNHLTLTVTVPLGGAGPAGPRHFHPHSADFNVLSAFGKEKRSPVLLCSCPP